MRIQVAALALVSLLGRSTGFVLVPTQSSSTTSSSTTLSPTQLFISSWGTKGKGAAKDVMKDVNPEQNLQAYLPEPSAVEARANVDGTVLVSGCVNAKERTDQFMFDLLNDEESAFEFKKIIAFVSDAKFSKKRLLSRSARYTGLLDKLDFIQSDGASLPAAEQLKGAKSWLAVIDSNHLEQLKIVQKTAAQVADSLENVALLLVGANELSPEETKQVMDMFPHEFNPAPPVLAGGDGERPVVVEELPVPPTTFTIVAVGQMDEQTPEGQCFYQYADFGTPEGVIPAEAAFPRAESYRLITELLQLGCGRQRALSFARVYNVNVTEARLIKGLREAGYARPQEIDHMVRQGPAKYLNFVENWKNRNPDWDKGYTTDAWWEAEIYQKSSRKSAERDAAKEEVLKDERTKEVEKIAKEWVKREYFRQSMAGTLPETITEEEFTQDIWERAMVEADIKYRQLQGEMVDSETELADFKSRQERKKQTMLKRAKQELADLLGEDPDTLIPPDDDSKDDDGKKKK